MMDWHPALEREWEWERQYRTDVPMRTVTGRGWRRQFEAVAFVIVLAVASVAFLQPCPWKSQIHAFGRNYDRYSPCQCEIGWLWRGDTITMGQITRVVTNSTIVHSKGAPDGFFGDTTSSSPIADLPWFVFLQVGDDAYIPYALPREP